MSSVRAVAAIAVTGFCLIAGIAPLTAAASGATVNAVDAGAEDDGTADSRAAPNGSTEVVQTVQYRLLPNETGSIEMTMQYEVGSNVTALVAYGSTQRSVRDSHGFVGQENGRWIWNETTSEPSLTVRVTVNKSGPTFNGLGWVDAGDWAIAHPQTAFAYRSTAEDGWVYSWSETDRIDHRHRIEGEGFVGESIVYLGEYDTARANLSNSSLRIIEPAAANLSGRNRSVDSVRAASGQLRVGGRDRVVNVFVGPEPLRRGGITVSGTNDTQDMWVSERSDAEAPENAWVHEYVHTRQEFELGPGMIWFREASATYYAGLLSVRQGLDGRDGFDDFVSKLDQNTTEPVVMTNQSAWVDPFTPYAKGPRVLAALDERIRTQTGENRTLQAVFRRMNEREGMVTYGVFKRIVANVSGTSQDEWLDERVAGPAPVSPPTDPFTYTSTDYTNDADDDGLSVDAERANGTHPFDPDSDGDGLVDGNEARNGTDPTIPDTDGDGLADGLERDLGTDPTDPTDPYRLPNRLISGIVDSEYPVESDGG